MIDTRRCIALIAISLIPSLRVSLADNAPAMPLPIDETIAYELLDLEKKYRPVPDEKVELLRSVLAQATDRARATHAEPRTREEALNVLEAIQIVLAKHNFIQPSDEKNWTDTLGDAFEPVSLTPAERDRTFAAGEANRMRKPYSDPSKPLYYVDCDMGSQLFLSVAERMGWDVRLVWIHRHVFVRWHLSPSEQVNWDWSAWVSVANDQYRQDRGPRYEDWPERSRFMKSFSPETARALFLQLMAENIPDKAHKRQLLERALAYDPSYEAAQNDLAWLYATDPTLVATHSRRAVVYALSAWTALPEDPAVIDTVACAWAAAGRRDFAMRTQEFAIGLLRTTGKIDKIPEYQARLGQMRANALCSDPPATQEMSRN